MPEIKNLFDHIAMTATYPKGHVFTMKYPVWVLIIEMSLWESCRNLGKKY